MKKSIYLLIVVSSIWHGAVEAGVIRSPVAVTQNTLGEYSSSFVIQNIFNQTGLSSAYVSGVTVFDTFSATHSSVDSSDITWASSATSGIIDFDLGAEFTIDSFGLWNNSNAWGLVEFTLYTDVTPTFSTAVNQGNFTPLKDALPEPSGMEVFNLPGSVGRYVRLEILNGTGGSQINELAFETSAASIVPVPPSVWLFGSGLLGLVGMARRKNA